MNKNLNLSRKESTLKFKMKFTKTIEVKNIFNKISYKYDLLNNLLSFGLHRLWKRQLVNLLEPSNGEDWADLCCGT